MTNLHQLEQQLRCDLIGINALHGTAIERSADTQDVRLRVAIRSANRSEAEMLLWEVESLLCCGPAGGGGFRGSITPNVVTHNAYLPRHLIETQVEVMTI